MLSGGRAPTGGEVVPTDCREPVVTAVSNVIEVHRIVAAFPYLIEEWVEKSYTRLCIGRCLLVGERDEP
jgi:hypothetical protein